MNKNETNCLTLFRVVMVFIGTIIILFSLRQQITDNYFLSRGIVTQGKVVGITGICSPVIEFIDNENFKHIISPSDSCDSPVPNPALGDVADVLYSPENPGFAKVVSIYSLGTIHSYGERWRIESLVFSMFGFGFIVIAFIPKRWK